MKKSSKGMAVIAFAFATLLSITMPANAVVMTDVDFTHSSSTGSAVIGVSFESIAQTFTVGINGTFHGADLLVRQLGGATADLRIALWTTSSGVPLSEVGAVTVAKASIGPTFATVSADFSSLSFAVSAGDILAVVLSAPGHSGGNAYFVNGRFGDEYAGGRRYIDFVGGGVVWDVSSPNSAVWDSSIKTFVDVSDVQSVPEPATLVLIGTSFAAIGFARRRKARKH